MQTLGWKRWVEGGLSAASSPTTSWVLQPLESDAWPGSAHSALGSSGLEKPLKKGGKGKYHVNAATQYKPHGDVQAGSSFKENACCRHKSPEL